MTSIIKVNTFQDANGNALFSSDGSGNVTLSSGDLKSTPYFQAYLNTSQTGLSDGVDTKIIFDSETFDADSVYDTSNGRFTPNQAGKYFVYAQGYLLGPGTNSVNTALMRMYKNGTQIARNIWYNGNEWVRYTSVTVQQIVDMNGSSDYIEIYAQQDTGGANWEIHGNSIASTFFGAYKLIGA